MNIHNNIMGAQALSNIVLPSIGQKCVIYVYTLRKREAGKVSAIFGPDVKNPLPNGVYATIPMPSSLNNMGKEIRNFG